MAVVGEVINVKDTNVKDTAEAAAMEEAEKQSLRTIPTSTKTITAVAGMGVAEIPPSLTTRL